jgi:hypothetical protein
MLYAPTAEYANRAELADASFSTVKILTVAESAFRSP